MTPTTNSPTNKRKDGSGSGSEKKSERFSICFHNIDLTTTEFNLEEKHMYFLQKLFDLNPNISAIEVKLAFRECFNLELPEKYLTRLFQSMGLGTASYASMNMNTSNCSQTTKEIFHYLVILQFLQHNLLDHVFWLGVQNLAYFSNQDTSSSDEILLRNYIPKLKHSPIDKNFRRINSYGASPSPLNSSNPTHSPHNINSPSPSSNSQNSIFYNQKYNNNNNNITNNFNYTANQNTFNFSDYNKSNNITNNNNNNNNNNELSSNLINANETINNNNNNNNNNNPNNINDSNNNNNNDNNKNDNNYNTSELSQLSQGIFSTPNSPEQSQLQQQQQQNEEESDKESIQSSTQQQQKEQQSNPPQSPQSPSCSNCFIHPHYDNSSHSPLPENLSPCATTPSHPVSPNSTFDGSESNYNYTSESDRFSNSNQHEEQNQQQQEQQIEREIEIPQKNWNKPSKRLRQEQQKTDTMNNSNLSNTSIDSSSSSFSSNSLLNSSFNSSRLNHSFGVTQSQSQSNTDNIENNVSPSPASSSFSSPSTPSDISHATNTSQSISSFSSSTVPPVSSSSTATRTTATTTSSSPSSSSLSSPLSFLGRQNLNNSSVNNSQTSQSNNDSFSVQSSLDPLPLPLPQETQLNMSFQPKSVLENSFLYTVLGFNSIKASRIGNRIFTSQELFNFIARDVVDQLPHGSVIFLTGMEEGTSEELLNLLRPLFAARNITVIPTSGFNVELSPAEYMFAFIRRLCHSNISEYLESPTVYLTSAIQQLRQEHVNEFWYRAYPILEEWIKTAEKENQS